MATTPSNVAGGQDWFVGGGEMGERIRAFDWSRTPLGPAETWSPALRMMVRFLLANRFPLLLWWGPQYVSVYNDPYRPVLGTKHPWALGQPVSECWKEIWHILQPLIDTPFHGGPATWNDDIFLEINRHGFVEETHFTIAYSPVPDETVPGGIGGVLATVHEITGKVVGDRRVVVLRDLGARSAEAKTAEEECAIAAEVLAAHPKDIPFALLYLIAPDRKTARLAGASGVATGERASPATLALEGDEARDSLWPLAEAMRSEAMETVTALSSRLAGQAPPGPWTDPPHTAVVVPVCSHKAHWLAGFLVAGVSPRLQLDDPYRDFLNLVSSQIAASIANAREREEERKRGEDAEPLPREELLPAPCPGSEAGERLSRLLVADGNADMRQYLARLRKQAAEAIRESEAKFRALFEHMLDGFAYCEMLFDEQGRSDDFVYLAVNDAFEKLTGLKDVIGKRASEAIPRIKELHPELFEIYDRVAATGNPERFEVDFKPLGLYLSVSVYCPAKGYFVAVFDNITARKQAEEVLRESQARQRAAEAVAAERQRLLEVLETLPAMVCLLTPDYRVAFANRSFREKFGEAKGRRCYECCFGRTEPCEFCETYKVLQTGQPHQWEVTGPDGSVIAAHDFPFTDVDGTPMILEMDMDITEQRRAQEALKDINVALEQRVAERTAELRTRNAELTEFNELTVDRELRMIELKREVNEMCRQRGEPGRYQVDGEGDPA